MSIKAWLDGDDVDLRCLADLFPYRGDGSFWINRQGGGRFYLSVPELDHPPAGVTHLQVTTALLAKANGIARTMRVIHASRQKCRAITAEMVVANVSMGRR